MSATNGTYNLVQASPTVATPPSLPEAAFSLTLKGRLDGQDAMITVRGASWEQFQDNVKRLRGFLDPVSQAPAAPETHGEGWCARHGVQMQQTTKDGRSWFSHRVDGQWCKGK